MDLALYFKIILLIFINDVLQKPGIDYTFNGGTKITFTTAPILDLSLSCTSILVHQVIISQMM